MTANPGGGDYVPSGLKLPPTEGMRQLRFRARFPEDLSVRYRTMEMQHFLGRALEHFCSSSPAIIWETLQFRTESPRINEGPGLSRVWEWSVWVDD